MFPAYTKTQAGVFKFLRFRSVFEKLRFRDGLVWKEGLIGEIKVRFQIFFRLSVETALADFSQNISCLPS